MPVGGCKRPNSTDLGLASDATESDHTGWRELLWRVASMANPIFKGIEAEQGLSGRLALADCASRSGLRKRATDIRLLLSQRLRGLQLYLKPEMWRTWMIQYLQIFGSLAVFEQRTC